MYSFGYNNLVEPALREGKHHQIGRDGTQLEEGGKPNARGEERPHSRPASAGSVVVARLVLRRDILTSTMTKRGWR